jgi:uncharacterized protein (DUF924 family)
MVPVRLRDVPTSKPMNPQTVIDFWFGELTDGFSDGTHRGRWYAFDEAFDRRIEDQFARTLQDAQAGELKPWLDDPRGQLAFIVLTDQFSRQIHRGTAQAFATDALALSAAREGIARGMDRELEFNHRSFFYMPFEHSEALIDQHTAVGLFAQLRDETPPPYRQRTGESLRHAQQHRDIIQRFGRFPHRNALLDRVSTEAEVEFLAQASGNFGQGSEA